MTEPIHIPTGDGDRIEVGRIDECVYIARQYDYDDDGTWETDPEAGLSLTVEHAEAIRDALIALLGDDDD